jgi:hypothetical protein
MFDSAVDEDPVSEWKHILNKFTLSVSVSKYLDLPNLEARKALKRFLFEEKRGTAAQRHQIRKNKLFEKRQREGRVLIVFLGSTKF